MAAKQRSIIDQIKEATALGKVAFRNGNLEVGIAAISLAAQLFQLARNLGIDFNASENLDLLEKTQ